MALLCFSLARTNFKVSVSIHPIPSGKVTEIPSNKSNNDGDNYLHHYSYGTADVEKFKRLHREYLVRTQLEEKKSSSVSTKAKSMDTNGHNVTTYAFASEKRFGFIAGYRNQIMALTMLVFRANREGHEQLLLDSLWHKDTYGTEDFEPFDFYFDVEAWNDYSYKKTGDRDNRLPRLVLYDPILHDQWDPSRGKYKNKEIATSATRPYGCIQGATRLMGSYQFYAKGKGKHRPVPLTNVNQTTTPIQIPRNPAEILMLQGALRPHPALQARVDILKKELHDKASRALKGVRSAKDSKSRPFRYMTLHARVEPDMQRHGVCKEKKVLNLQEIVDMVESKWPDSPPVDVVFLPINRQYIEKEGTLPDHYKNESKSDKTINWVAVNNLKVLNRLTNHKNTASDNSLVAGMWNGRVPVVEFGSEALAGTVYEHRPSISGAILNYFLGLDAHIFVGTEVSSFSHDILGARFYRDSLERYRGSNIRKNNYRYLPDAGLQEWITDEMISPPGLMC